MKKLIMTLGIFLSMPMFAADTPVTLETLRGQITTLTSTVDAMKKLLDSLRLGGAVGDISTVKNTVTNRGVQVVRVEVNETLIRSDGSIGMTKWSPSATYSDHGGSIPGVAVDASNGVTLPAGTYLFRTDVYRGSPNGPSANTKIIPTWRGGTRHRADVMRKFWWRWTGEGGHVTERIDGDVAWPMNLPAVFTFTFATTIKMHLADYEMINRQLYNSTVFGMSRPRVQFSAIVERL